jgi:hypothetical protein
LVRSGFISDLTHPLPCAPLPSPRPVSPSPAHPRFPGCFADSLCYIQIYAQSTLYLSTIMWTMALSGTLLAMITYRVRSDVVQRQLWWVSTLCVLVPVALTVMPVAYPGAYGVSGAWVSACA